MENASTDGNVACVLGFHGKLSKKCSLFLLDKTLEKNSIAETDFRLGCGMACVDGALNCTPCDWSMLLKFCQTTFDLSSTKHHDKQPLI